MKVAVIIPHRIHMEVMFPFLMEVMFPFLIDVLSRVCSDSLESGYGTFV